MSCSKFQLSVCMKRKNWDLDETIIIENASKTLNLDDAGWLQYNLTLEKLEYAISWRMQRIFKKNINFLEAVVTRWDMASIIW